MIVTCLWHGWQGKLNNDEIFKVATCKDEGELEKGRIGESENGVNGEWVNRPIGPVTPSPSRRMGETENG